MKKILLTLALCLATLAPVQSAGVLFPAQAPSGGRTCTDDTASANWLARTTGLSNTEADAYCNMIKGLESDGVITGTMSGANSGSGACGALLDALYIFVTNSTTTAGLNLCGTSYTLSLTGTCTFTADSGYPCDGTTGFFNTGFIPSTATTPNYVQNSAFVGAFIISSRTAATSHVAVGAYNGTTFVYLDPFNTGSVANYAVNIFNTAGSFSKSNAQGAYLANRSSSSLTSLYYNGSSTAVSTSATTSNGNENRALYISALDNNLTASNFSADTIGAAYIGGGATPLTNVQAAAIENRINTFLTVFGKNAF